MTQHRSARRLPAARQARASAQSQRRDPQRWWSGRGEHGSSASLGRSLA